MSSSEIIEGKKPACDHQWGEIGTFSETGRRSLNSGRLFGCMKCGHMAKKFDLFLDGRARVSDEKLRQIQEEEWQQVKDVAMAFKKRYEESRA